MLKILSLAAFAMLFAFVVSVSPVSAQNTEAAKRTEKFRQKIKAAGVGEAVRVTVETFEDKTFKGYIAESNDTDFTIVDKEGAKSKVSYGQVKYFSRKKGVSPVVTGAVIGALAGAGTFLTILLVAITRD